MKKVLAIALLLCLVLGAAFAAKGDIKVGGQLGYSGAFVNIKGSISALDATFKGKASVGGFGFEAMGLYDVTDDVSVKAAFGLSFLGKMKGEIVTYVSGIEVDKMNLEDDDPKPLQFSAYLGGQYAFEINKQIKVAAGAGLDMIFGKESKDDDAKTALNLGIGAEVTGSYAINKNIDVLLGARYSIYFVDSSDFKKELKEYFEDYLGGKISIFESGLKVFAGATYKI